MKKKFIKFALALMMFVAFSVGSTATGMNIIIHGDREVIQHDDYMEVYCHMPSNAICLGIIINEQGTFVVWDTGGNSPEIQVENNYVVTTDEDGSTQFEFQLVN